MSFFIPQAMAEGPMGPGPGAAEPMITMGMMVVFFVMLYFFTIRPQRKRQKEHATILTQLAKGDEVVLNSGMLGRVVKVDESYVVVNTGNNIELKFQKSAVMAMLPKGTLKSI